MFWAVCFCSALGNMVLAGAFASWYWAFRKPDDIPAFPLLRSFYRAIRYLLVKNLIIIHGLRSDKLKWLTCLLRSRCLADSLLLLYSPRYHLGTMALGSLILAIVKFIRVLLEYMDEKLKHAHNPIAEFAMKSHISLPIANPVS